MKKKLKNFLVDFWVALHRNKEHLFTKYYTKNIWGHDESRSGIGSCLEHTERLRKQLPDFFRRHGIKVIFDAPCGDYYWFRHVERDSITYQGGDIVLPLIKENSARYGDRLTTFIHFDITKDTFPSADLWLCRDVLFHLSEKDIWRALGAFCDSEIPWMLTTTFPEHPINKDIPTGSFRLINLEISPFLFPPAVECLLDSVPGWQKRVLGLWHRDTIEKITRTR